MQCAPTNRTLPDVDQIGQDVTGNERNNGNGLHGVLLASTHGRRSMQNSCQARLRVGPLGPCGTQTRSGPPEEHQHGKRLISSVSARWMGRAPREGVDGTDWGYVGTSCERPRSEQSLL